MKMEHDKLTLEDNLTLNKVKEYMKEWDDLWLNEGFGAWFGYKISNILYPELNILETRYINNLYDALYDDSFGDSKPIIYNKSASILIFDNITYDKKP